ncbi:hypothetical protein BZA05DRAFT_240226 [Tricharina praecox]|uniref:uncharacterized protein n=1 Tax=Tricharina praecox TaxID=43433 RepID=UPI00221FA888|nr:uncharacterized protein BZA05DRAFT_240226 [Tricharina praecox]KAI5855454.1 hypothetical protein BZA05DRAFT_240226 [Tricharina praecox]
MTVRAPRPTVAGPEFGPESPFPLRLSGPVIKGFGRGSKELQIPTANIPISGLSVGGCSEIESGVYFGLASLNLPATDTRPKVFPMVMSIGWNPFYRNAVRSVEVHIIHDFAEDFYGVEMRLLVLGWIRPELDYVSKDALIEDIKTDIRVGLESLKRETYKKFESDPYLFEFGDAGVKEENGEKL